MDMAQTELDASQPCNINTINEFYDKNLNSIINLGAPSPSSSFRTVSSTKSNRQCDPYITNDDGSSTASDSELDDEPIPSKRDILKYQSDGFNSTNSFANSLISNNGNVMVVNHIDNNITQPTGTRIETVAIQNSSDIQFGNKTFYNGPVTIKQFLLDEKNNKWIARTNDENTSTSGNVNEGFRVGSQDGDVPKIQQTSNPENKDIEDNFSSNSKIKSFILSKPGFFLSVLTTICVVIGIVILIIFIRNAEQISEFRTGDGDDSRKNIAINSTIGSDLLPGKVLRIISRDEWLAQPPSNELESLSLPVHRVVITHTATEACETQAACTLRVRLIQTFHMESRNWDDIGYNFAIGGDGAVYECRGWDRMGAHTKGYNNDSIGIAYIGTFIKNVPNERQLTAGFLLMNEGVKLGKLVDNYKIYAHRQLIASESPGAAFYEIIKTWLHWTDKLS